MLDRLPLNRPYLPNQLRWRLVDSTVDGPESFGLPEDTVSTDGGGWWVADFGELQASRDEHHRAIRGLAVRLRGGRRIEVPYLEIAPTGGTVETSFSDDTLFADGSGFDHGLITAVLEEAVSLRDDTALIRITSGPGLRGSDVFSLLRSEELGSEMHMCDWIEEVSPGLWSVRFGPQMRQDHPAGTPVNLNDPTCAMRLQDKEGGLWGTAGRAWMMKASARFVEAVR